MANHTDIGVKVAIRSDNGGVYPFDRFFKSFEMIGFIMTLLYGPTILPSIKILKV